MSLRTDILSDKFHAVVKKKSVASFLTMSFTYLSKVPYIEKPIFLGTVLPISICFKDEMYMYIG